MSKYLSIVLAGCLAFVSIVGSAATSATYSMKIDITKPKGSAADAVSKQKNLPATTPLSPCTTGKVDALAFKLTYNAGKSAEDTVSPLQNVYLFFYNPNALGAVADDATNALSTPFSPPCKDSNGITVPCDPRVWALARPYPDFPGVVALTPLADVGDIVPGTHSYLSAGENLGGTITETLLRSYLIFDGLHTGIWELVGIVADPTPVDFKDSATWSAWDVGSFMLGAPWTDTAGTCN